MQDIMRLIVHMLPEKMVVDQAIRALVEYKDQLEKKDTTKILRR